MINAVIWVMWVVYMAIMCVTGILDAQSFSDVIIQAVLFLFAGFIIPASLICLK